MTSEEFLAELNRRVNHDDDQAYYWTPEYQAGVHEAREQYKRGEWEVWQPGEATS